MRYLLTNEALTQDIEAEIREKHKNYTDEEVAAELLKVQKQMTLFAEKNRKSKFKKAKKVKDK